MEATELGEQLVKGRVVTADQLDRAQRVQKEIGGSLSLIITKLGFADEQTIIRFFSKREKIPIVNLEDIELPRGLIAKFPRDLIKKYHMLPIRYREDTLTVATSDPYDLNAVQEFQIALDCKIVLNLCSRGQITKFINILFSEHEEIQKEELVRSVDKETHTAKSIAQKIPPHLLKEALIPLLVEKKVITYEDLQKKVIDMGLLR